MTNLPQSPFPDVPPTLADETLGAACWLTDPPGMLNRYTDGSMLNKEHIEFITVRADQAMQKAFPNAKRFFYIHDLSMTSGHSSEARQTIVSWGKLRQSQGVVEHVFVVPPKMNAILSMAVETAILGLHMFNMKIKSVKDLDALVQELKLRPFIG